MGVCNTPLQKLKTENFFVSLPPDVSSFYLKTIYNDN